jgi:hypothetical protein
MRVENPHITILYGLHADDPGEVETLARILTPIPVTLGRTAVFETKEHDCLHIEVQSVELELLNGMLHDYLEHTDTQDEFKPHVTIAYLKKGEAKQYAGDDFADGQTFLADAMVFSNADGDRTTIRLGTRLPEAQHYAFDPNEPRDEEGKWTDERERAKQRDKEDFQSSMAREREDAKTKRGREKEQDSFAAELDRQQERERSKLEGQRDREYAPIEEALEAGRISATEETQQSAAIEEKYKRLRAELDARLDAEYRQKWDEYMDAKTKEYAAQDAETKKRRSGEDEDVVRRREAEEDKAQ